MHEIEMPPQDLSRSAVTEEYDHDAVKSAVFQQASIRLNTWLTFVLEAAVEFEANAKEHIGEIESEVDAAVDFSSVAKGLTTVLPLVFPGGGTGLRVITTAMEIVAKELYSHQQSLVDATIEGAKRKLEANVVALTQALRSRTTMAFPTLDDDLDESIEEALTWVDSASTEPRYVAAMCDYMGILEPTRENTIAPIRQELENEFFGLYQGLRAELLRSEGVPGLDDDDLSPAIWSHDAREEQQRMYDEARREDRADGDYDGTAERVWDDAYRN